MSRERSPVGQNIRLARQERGLTNDQLAHRVGIPVRYIQRWQSGGSDPTWENLKKVASVLEHDPDWFYKERTVIA